MIPNIETWQAVLGLILVAFLFGFGFSIGAWLWGKITTALKI